MKRWIDQFFSVSASQSTISRELLGGVTTFMTMAYIIFVNPAILSAAFVDPNLPADDRSAMLRALACATCLSAGLTTLLMGVLAQPVLAPVLGQLHILDALRPR